MKPIVYQRFSPLVITFFLLFSSSLCRAQTCLSDLFAKRYIVSGFGYPGTFEVLPDGGYMMSGQRNSKQTIMRTNPAGNVLWSRIFDFAEVSTYYQTSIMRKDMGNNFISTMNGDGFNFFDLGGTVLKMRQLKIPRNEVYIEDIAVTADNRKIILVHDESTYPDEGNMLVCLNADMSAVLWTKHISRYNLYLKNLLIKGNKIIVTGWLPNDGIIMSFDATDGTLLQQKFFRINNQNLNFQRISAYDSGYLIRALYVDPATGSDNCIFRFDTAFNVIRVYRPNGIFSNAKIALSAESDGSFYGAWSTTGAFIHHRFYVTREDSLVWSRYSLTSGLLTPVSVHKTNAGLLVYGSGTWNNVGVGQEWGQGITISDANGNFTNCQSYTSSFQKITLPYTESAGNLVSRDTSMITLLNLTPVVTDLPVVPTSTCSAISNCSSLSIAGPLTACTAGNFQYFVQRNAGCVRPVQWQLTGGSATSQVYSDSSILISFSQPGNYTLIASIGTDCVPVADTIQIQVQSGQVLDLGPPVVNLCAGNSFLLRAQPGFGSYLWQDGSSGTDYPVTGPGVYHVTVTNTCGQVLKDTVTVTAGPPASLSLGPDRSICAGDTLQLQSGSGFTSCNWGPAYKISGLSGLSVKVWPDLDTIYFASGEHLSGCRAFDSVRIDVRPSVPVDLGLDRSFCEGDSIVLDPGPGFVNYLWSNGSLSRTLTVKTAGQYSVIAESVNGCRSYDTLKVLNVWQKPVISLDKKQTICEGEIRILSPGIFNSYLWHDGSSASGFTVTAPGLYFVTVTDQHSCSASDTVRINTMYPRPSGFLPDSAFVCNYGGSLLQPSGSFASYLWSNGLNSASISISQPGLYWLMVADANQCKGTDTVVVLRKDCLKGFYMPNAFTPDNNGRNDIIKPVIGGALKQYQFTVYNRWGKIVFSSNDLYRGWDGKLNGVLQDGNVFAWVCNFQLEGEKPQTASGTFVLIR